MTGGKICVALPISILCVNETLMRSRSAATGFREELYNAINALPDDWDMLQLNSCNPRHSKQPVRANIYVTHESSCALAYICRRSFALKVKLLYFLNKHALHPVQRLSYQSYIRTPQLRGLYLQAQLCTQVTTDFLWRRRSLNQPADLALAGHERTGHDADI